MSNRVGEGRARLASAIRALRGEAWSALRAIADHPADVARLLEQTSFDRIDRPIDSPAAVGARIESLAAWDVKAMGNLVRSWPRPRASASHPWWREAWRRAARHLVPQGTLLIEELDPVWHAEEIFVLGPVAGEPWSVEDAALRLAHGANDDPRRLSRRPLTAAPASSAIFEDPSWQLLRVLRGRGDRIDDAARALLARRALHETTRTITRRTVLLAETLVAIDDPSVDALRTALAHRLPRATPSADLELACTVLATSWTVP